MTRFRSFAWLIYSQFSPKRIRAKYQTARLINYRKRHRSLRHLASVICAVLLLGAAASANAQPLPSVTITQPEATEDSTVPVSNTTGHIDFLWEPTSEHEDKQWEFELQGATDAAFEDPKIYYRGADERTFISGLAGGNYFFRIRIREAEDTAGPWSDTLAVEVDYVGMAQVQTLMIIGAICLAATVAIILGGSLRTRRELADQS